MAVGHAHQAQGRGPWEATFDHGEEGIGLWLDPAVQDDPVYAESWAGHRPVEVTIEEDQIVIRRAGAEEAEDGPAEPEEPQAAPRRRKPVANAVSEEPELDSSSEEPEGDSAPEESDDDSDQEPEED